MFKFQYGLFGSKIVSVLKPSFAISEFSDAISRKLRKDQFSISNLVAFLSNGKLRIRISRLRWPENGEYYTLTNLYQCRSQNSNLQSRTGRDDYYFINRNGCFEGPTNSDSYL